MIELPIEKIWSGDGFGQSPVTLSQIKRTETVALYKRTLKSGTFDGYEVFVIKMRHKGDPLPGGMFEAEDREVYPAAGSFGKTAFHIMTLEKANAKFDELQTASVTDDEDVSEKVLLIPVGTFSTNEFAASNGVDYPIASIFIKDAVNKGTIKFVREERRNVKGKATKLFEKV